MRSRMFWFVTLAVGAFILALTAGAQEGVVEAEAGFTMSKAVGLLAAALAIALSAFAGTLAQGRTASATMEGIARNPGAQPQMFMPWIVSMALIESLVIYGWVIAFMILGKIK